MAIRDKDAAAELRGLARSMFFSNEVIDSFLGGASAAQVRCVADLIGHEMAVRERNKRARLYRRARFPQPKSFDGYDFSQVAFPDGYTAGDLRSLAFVADAQDFVFHGQTGRGKTHLAIAVGSACIQAGMAVRFDLCQYFGHKFLKNQAAFDSLPAACSCAVSSIGSVLSKKPSMASAGIL